MWWESLTNFQQVIFIFAVAATALLVVFLILMFIGLGSNADFDDVDTGDFDADGAVDGVDVSNDEPLALASELKLFTLRGVLAFFAIGGWAAFLLNDVMPWWGALLIGVVCGVIVAFLLALLMKQLHKLENNGNVDYNYAIGKMANVYIRIPANGESGKVIVQFNDRYLEVDAVSGNGEELTPGTFVKIIGLKENNVLVVEK